MLRKLLKHDFNANLKVFLFIWPAIIIFGILSNFVLSASEDSLGQALVMILPIFILSVMGSYIFALITTATRFYSGLLGREGYLMFTLPAKTWQIILSKFIVSFTTISVTSILALVSCGSLVAGIVENFVGNISYSDMELDISALLTALVFFTSVSQMILHIYLACSLGHLFRKKRLLWSILCYYGINIVTQTATSAITLYTEAPEMDGDLALLITAIVNIALGVGYFFACERILSRKLNLE